ncbi:hypothetical protein BMS3Bbin12_00919 [bacterium BMS3Bbin12]|nr:hypothetical protein BMS3Abin12_02210 [bacterium BMS3Abin12]GBE47753.1 hypothetical protein BMS3Bbin12_00919 [bacterium BMS3Bbin12]GBE49863.1 hypothetical protein BMS3Bbin13_00787 [bacterium BMS3Bbin13]
MQAAGRNPGKWIGGGVVPPYHQCRSRHGRVWSGTGNNLNSACKYLLCHQIPGTPPPAHPKLKRIPLPGEKSGYVWAAPRLCYLPVRIAYQRSDGPAFNMVLDALQGNITTAAQARTDNATATP